MPFHAFDVYEFSPANLYKALANKRLLEDEVAAQSRARYLYGYLRDIGAKTIVVEYDYTDGDYLDDFAAYYVKCFATYERRCKRLHFFSIELNRSRLNRLIKVAAFTKREKLIRKAYLGFVIARPLPDAIVGRSVLATYPDDGGRRNYSCTKEYHANLFGNELPVQSLAFQEQDTVLAACATVSLWCCFHKTAELFGTPSPSPAAITRAATHFIHHARPIPSHGLAVLQICNAIEHVGLEPEVIHVKKNVPLISLIYGYLKMGLPVILGVRIPEHGLHAITLTGYSLRRDRVLKQEVNDTRQCIPMVGLRIDEFYAHDDQVGPFSWVRVNTSPSAKTEPYPVTFKSAWTDNSTGDYLPFHPDVVIIPVYHKIRVTFLDIQKWLTALTEVLSLVFPADAPLEWDIYLTTTNDFKKTLKSSNFLNEDILKHLLLRQHPRFIWRAILRHNGVDVFELLTDATDMARSLPFYQVIWHNLELKAILSERMSTPELHNVLADILTPQFLALLMKSIQQSQR